ncbi:MAG TPA: orotate phosphoribosyltransferase [Candidatus Aenigmarchaeota archaeon]|nr:orotate phosphoribosyltransferase [Candidatus Aenigmarchaeota archaeon]
MEIGGICAICGKASQHVYTCKLCGAIVCEKHFDFSKGVCVRCLQRRG